METMTKTKIGKETYLYWYELMLLLRRFEEKCGMLYGQKIRGFLHLYIGQEAVAAGLISAIKTTDSVITAYRDHALAIAKGISVNEAMAELFGKANGCSKGKGGSMHFFSKEHNFFGGHGIVGAQIPIGTGIALAEKYKGTDNVCICFFGDGAAWQGALHESLNMASLWNLPIVYVCENNNYAMGTSVQRATKVKDIYKVGEAFGIPCEQIDGMRTETVYEAMKKAVDRARKGKGPSFLEIKTYRYKGHSVSDPGKYRTKEELEKYRALDPIENCLDEIKKNKFATEKEMDAIHQKVKDEIEYAVKFADESPFPEAEEVYRDIYTQQDYPFIKEGY